MTSNYKLILQHRITTEGMVALSDQEVSREVKRGNETFCKMTKEGFLTFPYIFYIHIGLLHRPTPSHSHCTEKYSADELAQLETRFYLFASFCFSLENDLVPQIFVPISNMYDMFTVRDEAKRIFLFVPHLYLSHILGSLFAQDAGNKISV